MFQRALLLLLVMAPVANTYCLDPKCLMDLVRDSVREVRLIFEFIVKGIKVLLKMLEFEFFGNEDGCIHECPEGMVPKSRNKTTVPNGCGALGIKPDILTALMFLLPDVDECCNKHDKCYDTCNLLKDFCDDIFFDCLKSICAKQFKSKELLDVCQEMANMAYRIPKYMGCKAYREAQRNVCVCVQHQITEL